MTVFVTRMGTVTTKNGKATRDDGVELPVTQELLDFLQKAQEDFLGEITSAENMGLLLTASEQALANNSTFLANGSPSNAQVLAQVRALTRQMNALIRITTKSLQDISDT